MTTAEAINTALAKTDEATYKRLLAQNSTAIQTDKSISHPIYFASCFYCGWHIQGLLSLEEVECQAEEHLENNAEHAGCILTAFDLKSVQVTWR